MKLKQWRIAVLWALTLMAARGQAAEYVVAGASPQAADNNAGTAAQPLKTINKAAELAHAGDTVMVKAGIYREAVRLGHSGSPTAPITFTADPPGSVLVTGADVITGWQKVAGAAPIYRVPWNHFFAIDFHNGQPIEHHPEDAPLWGRAEQVIADGKQLLPVAGLADLQTAWTKQAAALKAGGASPVLQPPVAHLGGPFSGMFAVDTTNKKELYIWLGDGSDPNAHKLETDTRARIFGTDPWENKAGVAYINVRGFIFRYGATFPQRAAVWLHGQHNLMENCVIEQMAGSGVNVGGTLRRCVVRGCGQVGGAAGGDGFLNEECLWEGNCWKPISRDWDAGGVKMTVLNGGVFRRCVFRRNGGPGLWFDIDVRNVLVTECVFQENEGAGLFVEISRNIQALHNLALGNATGVVGHNDDWSAGGLTLAESENCILAYNTCVGNKDGITFREQGPRPLNTDGQGDILFHDMGDIVVGNVCALNQGYQLGLWYDNAFFGWHPAEKEKYKTAAAYDAYLKTIPEKVYDPTQQGHIIDRNLYFGAAGKPLFLYGTPWRPKSQTFSDLPAFSAKTGFDTRSLVADPAFVNAAALNYQFKPSSPARAQQLGWAGAPTDIDVWMNQFLPTFR